LEAWMPERSLPRKSSITHFNPIASPLITKSLALFRELL